MEMIRLEETEEAEGKQITEDSEDYVGDGDSFWTLVAWLALRKMGNSDNLSKG